MSLTMDSVSSGASYIWQTLGMELVIFMVTLLCAFIMRGLKSDTSPKSAGKGKGLRSSQLSTCSDGEKTPPRCKDSGDATEFSERTLPTERRNLARDQMRSPQRALERSPMKESPLRRCTLAAPKIIDEVVEGMREHQHLKFAFKALALHDELRVRLNEDSITIHDAVRYSRHSAVDFYTTVVHCAIRAGRHPLIEPIFDEMITQGVGRPLSFYESTMKQLAGQKQYQLALAVYDRLAADGLEPSAVTCSCLIGFAAEVGELQRAVTFFQRLSSMTTPSIRAFMTVLRVHAKRQDWEASLATLRDMQRRKVQVDALALNVVLATGVSADKLDGVSELLREADSCNPPLTDVVSYNTLVKGYAQRGDVDGAVGCMSRMRTRGLKPNAITFNTAMDSAVRSGRCGDAWRLFDDFRASGLRPDKFTCSILIKGLTKNREPQWIKRSLDVLHDVDAACDASLRSAMYHTVLEAAAQASDDAPSLTADTFTQMRRHNVVPTPAAQRLLVQRALPNKPNS